MTFLRASRCLSYGLSLLLLPSVAIQSQEPVLYALPVSAVAQLPETQKTEADHLLEKGIQQFYRGQTQEALATFQAELKQRQSLGDQKNIWRSLGWLGLVHDRLGNYPLALDFHQKSLLVSRENNNKDGIGSALNNIGGIYDSLGEYPKALDYYQRSLAIREEIGDRRGVGESLNNIGFIYSRLGEYPKALDYYQRSLAIREEIGDKEGKALTLNNIGRSWELLSKPEIAITFLKQAVNEYETIRINLQSLEQGLQESFTQKISGTYRGLADLLLEQGRVLEAQRILEQLKLQEIRNYTRNVRAVISEKGIEYTPIEKQILQKFKTVIVFSKTVSQCVKNNCPQKSQLNQQKEELLAQFNQEIDSIITKLRQTRAVDPAFYNPQLLGRGARKIVEAHPQTLLIYPVVLPDIALRVKLKKNYNGVLDSDYYGLSL